MTNNSKYVCSFVRRRKNDLINLFGGKCCLCGFNLFQEALEFHHVVPEEKEFSVTSSNMKSLETQLQELKKCVLVCANCHRGIHAGYYEVPTNWKEYYDENYANILREKLKLTQQGKLFYCKSCGKEISKKAQYCPDCYTYSQRRTERPSRETLKDLIRNDTFSNIGRIYGVSDNTIRKWCKAVNLPTRKTDIKNISDLDWEKI